MTNSNFYEMIERYTGKSNSKFLKICEPFFQTFGLNNFYHQRIQPDGQFYVIANNPDYAYDYYGLLMHECNPFIVHGEKIESGVYFFNSVSAEENFQSTVQFAVKKYNIKLNLLIVENDSECTNQYGFGSPAERVGSESLLLNNLPLVKEFIKYFNEEMKGVMQDLKANPVKIVTMHELSQKVAVPEIQLDYAKRGTFLKQIKTPKTILSHPKLSKGEIDCLRPYLKGKSSSEIGKELGISKRTVEFYVENVKNKLACYKKSELIELLIHMGKLGLYKELFEDGHIKISHSLWRQPPGHTR